MLRGAPAVAPACAAVADGLAAATSSLGRVERRLWVLAVGLAVLDVWLTIRGLEAGFTEGNPVVAVLLAEVGVVSLLVLKGWALGLAASLRWWRPRWGPWIALGLALPWLVAVGVNLTVLAN